MTVFSNFYFGSIHYFTQLLKYETFYLESKENYQKQTYRNRCYILGANGRLRLAIPILHNGKRRVDEIQISYDFNWQKEHLKSLQSAYQSSPYFEYYEDDIISIFKQKEKFLWDFNLKTLEFINQKLNLDLTYKFTSEYTEEAEHDYRNYFNAKRPTLETNDVYAQVFQEKLGFTNNLSILDLLCNEGPNAATYLKAETEKINSIINK